MLRIMRASSQGLAGQRLASICYSLMKQILDALRKRRRMCAPLLDTNFSKRSLKTRRSSNLCGRLRDNAVSTKNIETPYLYGLSKVVLDHFGDHRD